MAVNYIKIQQVGGFTYFYRFPFYIYSLFIIKWSSTPLNNVRFIIITDLMCIMNLHTCNNNSDSTDTTPWKSSCYVDRLLYIILDLAI